MREWSRLGVIAVMVLTTALTWASAPAAAAPVEGYQPYAAFRKQLDELDKSDLVTLSVLARTQGGREVVLITLSRGKPELKPALLIVGNVHAPHLAGGEMALRLARAVVARAEDDQIKPLLDRFTLYIIPRPSPDASEAFFAAPAFEREGNARATDDDRDGELDEDGPDDLNGDGVITMMRISDGPGDWMPHPDDARVLIAADPLKNELGTYQLLPEGRDNDEDEEFNEDGSGGVAFNRNFTHQYPYFEPGAGPHQVSEPETRAVADFAFEHTNIAAVLTFTPQDNLFHPWKPNQQADNARIKTVIRSADAPYQDFIAKAYREAHGGKDAPPSPDGKGSFSEWAYFHYGRWSFAARGWWVPKTEGVKEKEVEEGKKEVEEVKKEVEKKKGDEKKASDEKRGGDEINALRWLAANKIDGFVEWKKIDHPDFKGKTVEVGGFKPFVLLNPPVDQLDALTEKHLNWLGEVAGLMPKIAISEVKVEPLGPAADVGADAPGTAPAPAPAAGIFRVTVTVTNTGYLPTMSDMGRLTRQPHPLQLAIELPKDAKVINAAPRTQIGVLKGGGDKDSHTWLVRSPVGKAKVKVWSASVGEHSVEVELKTENAK